MADNAPHTAYTGIFVITRCMQHYDAQRQGDWYRIYGAGGIWHVFLEDRIFSPGNGRRPYVGQMLVRVRLIPAPPPTRPTRLAVIEEFSLLEPLHPGISHDELYP